MYYFVFILIFSFVSYTNSKPNVIIILADDLGYADVGYHGLKEVPTHNIDRIANEGVQFSSAYTNGSICGPTRAALMSGVYQQRIGCEDICGHRKLNAEVNVGMPLEVKTLAEYFKEGGYKTALFGKWHLGGERLFNKELMPTARGFDEFYGILEGAALYDDKYNKERKYIRQDTVVDYEAEYLTDALGREALSFITRNAHGPFFMCLSFTAVHAPMQASNRYSDYVKHIKDPNRRLFASMLYAMDYNIGRVLCGLENQGILDNTLIVFWSDNGGKADDNFSLNTPLRGQKTEFYEGGIRVPACIRWPGGGIQAGRKLNQAVMLMDIFPTSLKAADIKYPNHIEGQELLSLLRGDNNKSPHKAIYWKRGDRMAIRYKDWKLTNASGAYALYDLMNDLTESQDLIKDKPLLAKELIFMWHLWDKKNVPAHFGYSPSLPIEVPLIKRKIGQKAE